MQKAFNFEKNEDIKQTFDEFIRKERGNSNILDFGNRTGEYGNRIMFTTKEKAVPKDHHRLMVYLQPTRTPLLNQQRAS
jgi:hypothetical protein